MLVVTKQLRAYTGHNMSILLFEDLVFQLRFFFLICLFLVNGNILAYTQRLVLLTQCIRGGKMYQPGGRTVYLRGLYGLGTTVTNPFAKALSTLVHNFRSVS